MVDKRDMTDGTGLQTTESGMRVATRFETRGTFATLLDRLGLTLAISARPDQLLLVGGDNGGLTVAAAVVSRPLGLAVSPNRLAIATPRSIVVFANVPRLAPHHPGRPGYHDAFFLPRTVHLTGECQMHDMVFAPDRIIGANTAFSCICGVDDNFSFTPIWHPPFISEIRAEDRCHLNGFAAEDGELRYVTCLAATDTREGWRGDPDGNGVLIDAQTNQILCSGLCMPHSPRLTNGTLLLLNGGEGQVLRVDRATGATTVLASLPGFTHGLCVYGDILFVGLSQNRVSRSANPTPVARRHERLVAGVAAIEAATGRLLGVLEFTEGVTEIYDVQPLPGMRRAGIQGLSNDDGLIGTDTPETVFWRRRPPGAA